MCVGKGLERWVVWLGADHEGNIGLVKDVQLAQPGYKSLCFRTMRF